MIIAGIILIILQVIAIFGSLIGGGNPFSGGIFGIIGYFLAGIIGVILVIIGYNRKNNNKDDRNK